MELLVTFLNVILPEYPRMQIYGMFLFCKQIFSVNITVLKRTTTWFELLLKFRRLDFFFPFVFILNYTSDL